VGPGIVGVLILVGGEQDQVDVGVGSGDGWSCAANPAPVSPTYSSAGAAARLSPPLESTAPHGAWPALGPTTTSGMTETTMHISEHQHKLKVDVH
jgi:hypothetical protein